MHAGKTRKAAPRAALSCTVEMPGVEPGPKQTTASVYKLSYC